MNTFEQKKKRIIYSLLVFLGIIVSGVIGYMIIEDYTLLEALFMTIITISTVGYGEVRPLSEKGIIFSILLIIFSFILIGIVLENIISFFFDEEVQKEIKRRQMVKTLKKLKNHVIVCGYGRNGRHAVEELLLHGETVVVIEKDHELVLEAQGKNNVYAIEGDATNEDTLLMANIQQAKALITTLPNDADNVFVVLTAREFNPNIIIISRASYDHSESKLRRAGANYVIMPDAVGGHRMGKLVSQADVLEFLEFLMIKSGDTVNIEEIKCDELPKEYIGKSLGELDIRKKTGANVIGMKLPDGSYVFNPSADTIIQPNSKLFVIGTPSQVAKLKDIIKREII